MNALRRSTMRLNCLLAVPDPRPRLTASRGRRRGPGPAFVSAFTLHAVCLGALIGTRYNQMPPLPPHETIVELAMTSPELPAADVPPGPQASENPVSQLSTDEAGLATRPEPIEVAAMPSETAPPLPLAKLLVAVDPRSAATPMPTLPDPPLPDASPPAPETPVLETAAVVNPAPRAMEITPPRPQPKPLAPQPRSIGASPHSVARVPRLMATRQDSAAIGESAKTETNTPIAAILPSALSSANPEAALETRIRDAVQAAVRYPAAARMMGVTGRARVLLDYRSGNVGSPMLAQSSGASMLDEAALVAARIARYPSAPPEIEGRLLRLLVWVEFRSG